MPSFYLVVVLARGVIWLGFLQFTMSSSCFQRKLFILDSTDDEEDVTEAPGGSTYDAGSGLGGLTIISPDGTSWLGVGGGGFHQVFPLVFPMLLQLGAMPLLHPHYQAPSPLHPQC